MPDLMPDLNDLYYFVQVVDHGGFAPAGRALGIPKSKLSRRIALLEARLGARLLMRTTRQFAVTDIGQTYYAHCKAMLVEADAAEEAVALTRAEPRGTVRVTCPVALLDARVADMLAAFMVQYPLVQLDMVLLNRRVDLISEGIDVALRVRDLGDEDPALVTRRLRQAQMQLVAAPGFADHIREPGQLASLPVLGAAEADRLVHFRLFGPHGKQQEIALEPRLAIDDFVVRNAAVRAGLGFTALPSMFCEEELERGELVRLLPDWSLPGGYLQAVYPHRRGLLPAVRVWIDHLAASFEACGEKYV